MGDAHDEGSANQPKSGLLSIVAIARQFGINATAADLGRDNNIADKEISIEQFIRCASSLGLSARAVSVDAISLLTIKKATPTVVRFQTGSYMVIISNGVNSDNTKLFVQDLSTSNGDVIALDATSLARLGPVDLVLVKRNYQVADERQPFGLGLVTAFIWKDKKVVADVCISAFMLSLLALAPVIFWKLMTDKVLSYRTETTFWVLCLVLSVLIAFETCFSALRRYLLVGLTIRVDVKLSTYMFEKVLGLPMDFFETTPTGFILHQMSQMGRIRQFILGQLFGSVLDAGILLVFIPVMVVFSPLLTAFVLGLCMIIVSVIIVALPFLRSRSTRIEAGEANRGAMLAQTIQGMKTVKSMALDRRQRHQWDVLTAEIARQRTHEGHLSNFVQSIVLPLDRMVVSGSLALGVYIAITSSDPVAVGSLFAFLMLSQRVVGPLMQASQLIQQYDEARTAVQAIASLVNQPPEDGRSGNGVRRPVLGHVEFQGVIFSYKGALRPALRNLSFEVPRGTSLGVMGRSGSGKTTITRLLQRLHSDYSGLIKIDGVDVRQYDIDFLRSSLGVVLQENFLFSGSIRENITIAKPDATYDDMVMAARMAGAEEFIEKLPAGYETYVYEGSPNLSGGQRQRLAIARALITDPKILILDEATSALDAESEAIVNANIDRIAQGRTVITISHRLASLVKCDAIMVLDGGVIDDIGRHEELVERNDIYAHLWYTQNQHAGGPPPGPVRRTQPKLAFRGPN